MPKSKRSIEREREVLITLLQKQCDAGIELIREVLITLLQKQCDAGIELIRSGKADEYLPALRVQLETLDVPLLWRDLVSIPFPGASTEE